MGPVQCRLCKSSIADERIIGEEAFCVCGWYGPRDYEGSLRARRRSTWLWRAVLAVTVVLITGAYLEWRQWGPFLGDRLVLSLKDLTGRATAVDWSRMGVICSHLRRYSCAADAFGEALRSEPENLDALAGLAIAQTEEHRYAAAVVNFERLIEKGSSHVHTMAYYGRALHGLQRFAEAERWYYEALSLHPGLVDIADQLIDLLLRKRAYTEALSVIGNISAQVPQLREHLIPRAAAISELVGRAPQGTKRRTVRLASVQGHHYVPIQFLGTLSPAFFMVDTGATLLTLNYDFVMKHNPSGLEFVGDGDVQLADGRRARGQFVVFKTLKAGPWHLQNIRAVICDGCALLAGKSFLRQFQTTTVQRDGVEYMSLTR
ncbi:MAG: aspartyl protease family protein [Bdellovibrionales bacterium]